LVPSKSLRGSAAVHYDPELVAIHAVAVIDETPAEVTVCDKRVTSPENMTDSFDRFPPTVQCGRCTDGLGYEFRGER
jgi:hypothetical protein